MKEYLDKIKNWYQDFSSKKVSFERRGIKPKKHWMIIIFSMFILTLVLIAISSYFYIKVENGTLFSVPEREEISEIKVNNNLLDKIVEDFDNRERNLSEIKAGKAIPNNPSL
ncbi:MAG TPA: hypothetical protein PLZ99_02905 [Parcubacteria group bacterium]|jgi:hypothetical protein|nr:hypothetical protein [Parcubacteria group bacterium]